MADLPWRVERSTEADMLIRADSTSLLRCKEWSTQGLIHSLFYEIAARPVNLTFLIKRGKRGYVSPRRLLVAMIRIFRPPPTLFRVLRKHSRASVLVAEVFVVKKSAGRPVVAMTIFAADALRSEPQLKYAEGCKYTSTVSRAASVTCFSSVFEVWGRRARRLHPALFHLSFFSHPTTMHFAASINFSRVFSYSSLRSYSSQPLINFIRPVLTLNK